MRISLYWTPQEKLTATYHSFVHLVDAAGRPLAQSDRQPGGVYYPSSLWREEENLRDDHVLSIPPGTPLGVYRLLVGLYALSPDGAIHPLGEPVVAGYVAVKERVLTEPGDVAHEIGARFWGEMELVGYDVALDEQTLRLVLTWRAHEPPRVDYTVFVHLLDAGGKIVTQDDSPPRRGAYPTSVWDGGEVVADDHVLSLPADLAPGDYRLRVGLYLSATGSRVPVGGTDGVELGPVTLP